MNTVGKWFLGYGGEDKSKSPPHAHEDSKTVLADLADLPDDLFDHLGDTEKRELGRFLVKTLKSQDKVLKVL